MCDHVIMALITEPHFNIPSVIKSNPKEEEEEDVVPTLGRGLCRLSTGSPEGGEHPWRPDDLRARNPSSGVRPVAGLEKMTHLVLVVVVVVGVAEAEAEVEVVAVVVAAVVVEVVAVIVLVLVVVVVVVGVAVVEVAVAAVVVVAVVVVVVVAAAVVVIVLVLLLVVVVVVAVARGGRWGCSSRPSWEDAIYLLKELGRLALCRNKPSLLGGGWC